MSVVTEDHVRKLVADGLLKEKGEIFLDFKTILTPSARTYLMDKNITIKKGEDTKGESTMSTIQYETFLGVKLDEKPEHMTHLRGNLLVFKDHPRIALRGAIDSLESEIILAQIVAEKEGLNSLVKDLEEIITFIRKMLQCELKDEPLDDFRLQGLDEKDLRDQSWHPSKYFGINHFLPTYKKGEMVAWLNKLRTRTREAELIAFKAFKHEDNQVEHVDIIRGFNRLSSLFWIMMFKYMSGKYKE